MNGNNFEWVLQTNLIDQKDVEEFKQVFNYLNIKYYPCHVIPFAEDDAVQFLYEAPEHTNLIPYGSTSFIKHAIRKGWKGIEFNENKFTVAETLKNRNDCLNQDAVLLRVDQLQEKYKDNDPEEMFFIRPNKDYKEFQGGLASAKELCRWSKSVESGSFDIADDIMVALAKPKIIN